MASSARGCATDDEDHACDEDGATQRRLRLTADRAEDDIAAKSGLGPVDRTVNEQTRSLGLQP